jgi:hypothetical protein
MSANDDKIVLEQIKGRSPEKTGELERRKLKTTAAGLKAIMETMTHAFGKMGVIKGTRGLLTLNQKGGIDCQSCAWPDPDEGRTIAEFCESGAKALADEGTTKNRRWGFFFTTHDFRAFSTRRSMAKFAGACSGTTCPA